MFYEGLRLWEAQFVVFYKDLRLWEVVLLTNLWPQVGPLKKNLHVRGRGGVGEGGDARSVMFYKGLRLWGVSGSNEAVILGGSAEERPSRAWGEREGGEARFVVFYDGFEVFGGRRF